MLQRDRIYMVYRPPAPDKRVLRSRRAAWDYFNDQQQVGSLQVGDPPTPGAVSSEVRDAVVQVEELRPGEAVAVPPLPPRPPQPGSAVLAEELSDIVPEAQRPSTRLPPRTRRH